MKIHGPSCDCPTCEAIEHDCYVSSTHLHKGRGIHTQILSAIKTIPIAIAIAGIALFCLVVEPFLMWIDEKKERK